VRKTTKYRAERVYYELGDLYPALYNHLDASEREAISTVREALWKVVGEDEDGDDSQG
jgi:hypothetical protein